LSKSGWGRDGKKDNHTGGRKDEKNLALRRVTIYARVEEDEREP